jgi:hypothetical protein
MVVLGLTAGTPAILTEISCDFSQTFQENDGTVPRLGLDHFLPNPSQFFIL